MADYQNVTQKLGNLGLALSVPADLVSSSQYRRLQNVRTLQEGQLTTRFGLSLADTAFNSISNTSPVVWMKRVSDQALLIITEEGKVYLEAKLLTSIMISDTSSVSAVRFNSPETGKTWTYLSCSNGSWRIDNTTGTVYKWGIVSPSGFPSVSLLSPDPVPATGSLDSASTGTIPYQWAYTYYSTLTGAESFPSDPSDAVVTDASGTVFVEDLVPSTDPQVDRYRIYRVGGTVGDYRLEAEITMQSWESHQWYQSTKADDQISLNASLNFDVDVPFTTIGEDGAEIYEIPIPKIWGPFGGTTILAVGDSFRPGYVYWTNIGNPDMTSPNNVLPLTSGKAEPLLNGFIFGANAYAWSRDNLYMLNYGGPTAAVGFSTQLVPLGMGLSAPNGFTLGFDGVYFISKDGIYKTDCQQSAPISLTHRALRPLFLDQSIPDGVGTTLFNPIDWNSLDAIHLDFTGQELHFLYQDIAGQKQHFVYDVLQERWQEFVSTLGDTRAIYGDENRAQYYTLFALADGKIYFLDYTADLDNGVNEIPCVIRTGSWDGNTPLTMKEWGVLLVDADCKNHSLLVEPLTNAETTALTPWSFTNTTRAMHSHSLYDTYARSLALQLSWSGKLTLYQYGLLFHEDEEEIVHWETPETSFGIGGWKHVRDGYFALRSQDDVILQVLVDGSLTSYTLPSTAGERRMVYVKFQPTKGKTYRYVLDSALPFRFYGEDSFLNVKPWQTALSYSPQQIAQSVGSASYLNKQAGT